MRQPFSLKDSINTICILMSEGDEDLLMMLALIPNILELDENEYKKTLYNIDQCNIRGEQLAFSFEKELTELARFFDGEKEYPIVDFAHIYSKLETLPEQNIDWINYEMMCQNSFEHYAHRPTINDYLRLYRDGKFVTKRLKRTPITKTEIYKICENLKKDLSTKKEFKMMDEDRDLFLEYYANFEKHLAEQRKRNPTRIVEFRKPTL